MLKTETQTDVLDIYLGVKLLDMITLLNISGISKLFSTVSMIFYTPAKSARVPVSPKPHHHLLFSIFL